jgi:hypothetical protein
MGFPEKTMSVRRKLLIFGDLWWMVEVLGERKFEANQNQKVP